MKRYLDAYGSEIREFWWGEEFALPSIDEFGDFTSNEELFKISHKYNADKKIATVGYISLNCSIDIETTTVGNLAAPYLITICLSVPESDVFFIYHLRRISQINILFSMMYSMYGTGWNKNKTLCKKILCFCHNLSFDFYFMRKQLNIKKHNGNFFAKSANHCNRVETIYDIELRDTKELTNCSLEELSNQYTLHKKIKDLDYSVPRHTSTPLTDDEWRYVNDDVIILCEFEDVFFANWCYPNHPLPITNTSRLLSRIMSAAFLEDYSIEETRKLQPDVATLKVEQQYLMRGGLVGSNPLYRNEVVPVYMRDVTSSYPSVMLTKYFPMSAFRKVDISRDSWYYNDEPEDLKQLLATKCVKLHITYFDLHAKTEHCYELKRKCVQYLPYENDTTEGLVDGHVYKCEAVEVIQTELDYEAYKMFYTYSLATIDSVEVADRGLLPGFFRKCIADDYAKKGHLKAEGKKGTPEYNLSKLDVNTYFGATCKGLYISSVKYKKGEWVVEQASDGTLKKDLENRILSYYWGVWTSAHARVKLAKMLFKVIDCDGVVIYYDTDSLKYIPSDDGMTEQIFETENLIVRKANQTAGLTDDVFYGDLGKGLGEWDVEIADFEGKPLQVFFKTIGPKRYLYHQYEGEWFWNKKSHSWEKKDVGWHLCVSGLAKLAEKYLPEDPFNFFDEYGFDFEVEELERLITEYHPEEYDVTITDNYGVTETIHCMCGITLKKPNKHVSNQDIIATLLTVAAEKLERRGFI